MSELCEAGRAGINELDTAGRSALLLLLGAAPLPPWSKAMRAAFPREWRSHSEMDAGVLKALLELLENGADLQHQDHSGRCAIWLCARSGLPKTTASMLRALPGNQAKSVPDHSGSTPLHEAARAGSAAAAAASSGRSACSRRGRRRR